MHASSPVPPSLQMTPIAGIGPQPSTFGHGTVLRGGTQAELQAQAASFSLPQVLPLKVVPEGQTSAPGAAPHSVSAHCL
jgi:hypothetical protein